MNHPYFEGLKEDFGVEADFEAPVAVPAARLRPSTASSIPAAPLEPMKRSTDAADGARRGYVAAAPSSVMAVCRVSRVLVWCVCVTGKTVMVQKHTAASCRCEHNRAKTQGILSPRERGRNGIVCERIVSVVLCVTSADGGRRRCTA